MKKKLYESPELEFIFLSADVVRTSNEADGDWGDWTGTENGDAWGNGGWGNIGGFDDDLFG